MEKLKKIAKTYFEDAVAGHDWFHVERVYNLAMKIGKAEGADMSILKPAVLLHDIARKAEDKGEVECHAKAGTEMARKILKKQDYPREKIEKVARCIAVHRYKDQIKPSLKEAKILQDADRLDALGAVAIGRIFSFGGAHNRKMYDPPISPAEEYKSKPNTSINHFYEKIFNIKTGTFYTEAARKIASERYDFTKKYVDRFLEEWKGKR